jgi:hypothetical protein
MQNYLDFTCIPSENAFRGKYKIQSTTSSGENCGLNCLKVFELVGNDFQGCRKKYNLPLNGRLAQEEIAGVLNKYFSYASLFIEVRYDEGFNVDKDGNVLIGGYGLSLFKLSEHICGFVVIINESGHFSPVLRKDGQLIVPKDIIDTVKSIDGNNYQCMSDTIFTEFHTDCMRTTGQLKSLFNFM